MLGDTISVTYDTVAKTLSRVKQDGYGAEYFLDDKAVSNRCFRVTVKHTVPAPGVAGESHLFRLDVDQYDTASPFALLRTSSAWMASRTDSATQDQEISEDTIEAVVDFLTDATITKIVGRQS